MCYIESDSSRVILDATSHVHKDGFRVQYEVINPKDCTALFKCFQCGRVLAHTWASVT